MAKYEKYSSRPSVRDRPWEIHPIWRGFGCVLMVISPFIAFAGAHLLVNINIKQGWYPVPPIMRGPFTIPVIDYKVTHFYADLLVAVLLLLLGFAVVMILYSLIYSMMGPSRYGPFDAPPARQSQGPRKRR